MPTSDPTQGTIGALVGWSLTLTEPLLSLRRRGRLEDGLARVYVENKDVAQLFLAGVIADLMQTLPDRDPWRNLSAGFGTKTVGPNPPDKPGAFIDGQPFGSWHQAVDLTPLIYASPFDDPALVALAGDDLTPASGAFLAAGAYGWRDALEMLDQIWQVGPPADPNIAAVTDLRTRGSWQRGAALHFARESATHAIRWALHRRRGYVGADDPWPAESAFRWAYRTTRSDRSVPWSEEDVARAIEAVKITQLAPQDRPPMPDEF